MGQHTCESPRYAGQRQGQGQQRCADFLPPLHRDSPCPIPEFTEHLGLSCFVIAESCPARTGSPLKATIGHIQLPDHYCTVCIWLDFPLDPDTASESLSQRSKPAQHQSIRTDTDVFTCKNRPVHSQCMRQRSKAQKGEDACLKAHSKSGTE